MTYCPSEEDILLFMEQREKKSDAQQVLAAPLAWRLARFEILSFIRWERQSSELQGVDYVPFSKRLRI